MQSRKNFLPIFLIFTILSLCIILLSRVSFFSNFGFVSSPFFSIQSRIYALLQIPSQLFIDKNTAKLQEENLILQSKLWKMQQIQQDNVALQDQFETSSIPTTSLLPATVIGDPQFIPHVTSPESFILDKGSKDGVKVGNAVIYKDNLVGTITASTNHASAVTLVSNTATSFTAKTQKGVQGVLTGQGNGNMVLGNVLLSDSLQIGDIVVTNGSVDLSKKGIPPGLVIGKIISVSKNPSSLYQSASVESVLHVEKLTTVFIMTN